MSFAFGLAILSLPQPKVSNQSAAQCIFSNDCLDFKEAFAGAYHCGFNMGFNCAESTNFATESWLKVGAEAKSCKCTEKVASVVIDMSIFLHLANPKAKKAILSHLAPASSVEDSESRQESVSAASSGAECSLSASIDDASGSQATAPAANKKGRKPGPTGPGKRGRSPDTVLLSAPPPQKRARLSDGQSSKGGPGKPVTSSKVPVLRHAPRGLETVEKKKKGHEATSVLLGNAASRLSSDPVPKLRRGSVAMVATTSLNRKVGRPGSRQRALAVQAARKLAGILWTTSVKRKLAKSKPVGASALKSPGMKHGVDDSTKKGPGRPREGEATTLMEQKIQQGAAEPLEGKIKKGGRPGRAPCHPLARRPKPANVGGPTPQNHDPAPRTINRKHRHLRAKTMSAGVGSARPDRGQSPEGAARRSLAQSKAQAGPERKSRRLGLCQRAGQGLGPAEPAALSPCPQPVTYGSPESSKLELDSAPPSSKAATESAAGPALSSKMKAGKKGERAARFSLRRASLQSPKAAAPSILLRADKEVPSTPTKRARIDAASCPVGPATSAPTPKQREPEAVAAVAVGRSSLRARKPTYKVAGTRV